MQALLKPAFFAAALGLAATAPRAQPIDISGVVKDPASGAPLPGVIVSLVAKGLADTTDGNGQFHILRAPSGLADRSPLQRLAYSARHGFALRMTRDEDVVAEIRNGAGRTVVHGGYSLMAGDWSLKPRNLEPGLYTVMLWTGSRLRALRLTIPASDKGRGKPAWTLSRMTEAESLETLSPPVGSAVDSLRLVHPGYAAHRVAVQSWSQGGITVLPRRLAGTPVTPK